MKRPRRRPAQESCVKILIDILEKEIGPKFNSKKNISKHCIHKQVNNKYHKVFLKIIEYLEDLRGGRKNKLRWLIRDYLTSVHEYYQRFSRIPSLFQLSPSTSNQIRFEEWIYDSMRLTDEDYWLDEIQENEIIDVPIHNVDFVPNFIEV